MRKRILVVDDNADMLDLLRLTLKTAGFCIATATNGIDALKKARSMSPDVIILDLVLPELDGFAVCETLRRGAETSHIPVILLTGLHSQFARLAGMESGATEFITKPTSMDELVDKVRGLLDGKVQSPHQVRLQRN